MTNISRTVLMLVALFVVGTAFAPASADAQPRRHHRHWHHHHHPRNYR